METVEEQKQIDELIEEMKTRSFPGAVHVRRIIDSLQDKPDFYRKGDLIDVLFKRYDELWDDGMNDILNSFAKKSTS